MTSRLGWRGLAPVLGLLALGLRLVPVLRGGGLFGLGNYDDGVYFAAGTALAHGLLPYRDFLLLHPPGMVLALLPFGLLGRVTGDPTGFAAARLACMSLGAVNALLVGQVVRPLGTVSAALGALLYAVSLPAIYVEHTTLLEGPAQTCVLLALLLVRPLDARPLPGARAAVWAGVLVGASATFKIWGVVAVLALVGWFLAVRAVRTALQVLAGAAVSVGLICLPFFVAAPVHMWQMVVLDQLGRPRSSVSVLVRLGNVVGLGLLNPARGGWVLVVAVALVAVLVLLVLACTVPIGRLATAVGVVLTGVLVASPSWFLHYPALATGPLCVALVAGAHRLAGRLRAAGRPRAGVAVPVLLGVAAVLQCWPLVHFTPGSRFPGASLGRAAAGVACVTSDDPAALVEMNVLGRDLDDRCPFVADVGGYSYEVARRSGRESSRRVDAAWQQAYVEQLRTGGLTVPFRYVRTGSLSAATLATLDRWPVAARVGTYALRRPAPAAGSAVPGQGPASGSAQPPGGTLRSVQPDTTQEGVRVSVVVPVYNAWPYLERCAEAIVRQTLSAERYEAIFVDDGSTDASGRYLDDLAREHRQVRVVHQTNSGWPGRPRNVGLDAARGDYVFFCDADDWLAEDALADLCDFADANGSDIVLPKMAGLGQPVPHHVFRRTVQRTSLQDGPLMESLTAHKLFRRSFLERHDIRFPEGRRRLEDHYFVVLAYLTATVVSIYAEHTCYSHLRRDDAGNISTGRVDWPGYFGNLAEAVALVEQHLPPGPARDRVLRRWLQTEMVARMSGARFLALDPEEAGSLVASAHAVAAAHFSSGVVELLAPGLRPVARALLAGDEAAIRRQAEAVARWKTRVDVLDLQHRGPLLRISGLARQHEDVDPLPPEAPEDRFLRVVQLSDAAPAVASLARRSLTLTLTERATGEQWPVPAIVHGTGLSVGFTADADLRTLAAGNPVAAGTWDLHAHYRVLGLGTRVRARLVDERSLGELPVVAGPAPLPVRPVLQRRALALEVGLRADRPVERPTTLPGRLRHGLRWRWRRLRRALVARSRS